jgi:hypothetical protein
MLPILAVLVAATLNTPAPKSAVVDRTEWVFSTIAHSEWCPAGNVMLDLRTGQYTLIARAPRKVCNDAQLERPVSRGRLQKRRLEAVRAEFLRVLREGVGNPECQSGRRPRTIVMTNGGTPVMVLTTGRATVSAPSELTCWSDAANGLHGVLDHSFGSAQQR